MPIHDATLAPEIGTSACSLRSPFGVPKIRSPESEPDIHRWDEIWTDLEELTAPYVESYVEGFGSDHPPQKALSVEAVLERQPDDLFWSDVLFDSRDELWASDLHCQKGIQALLDRDRCHEELRRLRAETARLIRWTCEQDRKLRDVFGLWAFGLLVWERGNEDVELDNFPSRDFCIRSLFLVSEAREAHRILELHWVRDGLVRAWKGQPDPELWRSRCDPALRNIGRKTLEGRGTMGGAVDFSVIRQEIEKLPDKAGSARELIGMIARGSGESSSETGTSEAMDIDVPPNDQPWEGDGDWTGVDDEEELLVLDDEVSDDDLADAMEMDTHGYILIIWTHKESAYIYVGGLPFELTEGDLITIFSQWGEIMDVNLVRDKETGKSRGFGFLMYEDQRSTVLAVDNMNGTQIIGRTLKVDHTRNYRQQGKRDENGEYEEPEGPTYNAMPPILSGSESSSSEDEQDDLDEEDPMAAFIRAEKKKEAKKIKGNNGDGKKRKHEGETKEERQARKEAKRAKKAEKEEKKKRKEGREGSEKRERRDESERAKSVRSERDEKKGWSKDREDSFWSRGKNAADRDDWRQGKWEMERKKESREKREERPRERDGDAVKDLPENHLDRSTGKGGGGSGRERELEEKPRDRGYRREDDRRRDDGRRKDDKDRDRAYSRRDDGDKDHDRGDHSRRNDRERDMRY
ncbi:hypothetical protein LQV05_006329 [Cryptococcus neoformans]|nr:hypothetical protein LQV05_006329 [Cryptococcus neoformans]